MAGTKESKERGYANGRARREEIIRIASEYFADRGFLSATVLDIAAVCKISRPGLLHHFSDKEALLEAVLEARDIEDRERFRPYVRGHGGMGVLRGMVDLAAHNRLVPGMIELFVRLSSEASAPDHPAHVYFRRRYARIRTSTSETIATAIGHGHLRADLDPDDAALRLTAAMDGLQTLWLYDRSIDMAGRIRTLLHEWMTPAGALAFAAAEPDDTPDDRPDDGPGSSVTSVASVDSPGVPVASS
ncbi:AcrR family transcriptional regulator [Microbacterium resistens]|uniref:AcrR family transcriptional regulator n=1 Tax=Microbacterium resistens TaxID=156977 RepID=A0ABU1S9H2_9MICO|nr:TetR/AcrR family transcriptional regulator [Microbacterium resistens]MDR6865923.1 AcrR family transcriptional regulator [Microbacterium resistens]